MLRKMAILLALALLALVPGRLDAQVSTPSVEVLVTGTDGAPLRFFSDQCLDVIAEAFNVTDATNYDVNSIDTAQFLSGPALANPNFGKPRATLPGREIQLGLRWAF